MAMNYAWQERKKFAIPVGAGVFVLLLWYVFVLSGINGSANRDMSARKSAELSLRQRMLAGVPTDDTVSRAARDRTTLQGDLKDIQSRLAFQIDPGYRVKEGQGVQGKFGAKRQELFQKLEQKRTRLGIDQALPANLGFPANVQPIPEAVVAEWMIRLAVLDRVCNFAYDCQVGIKLPTEEAGQDEPTTGAERFLSLVKVKFRASGSGMALMKFIHGLQQPGATYLALVECDAKAEEGRDFLGVSMAAAALLINPEGALQVAEAKP